MMVAVIVNINSLEVPQMSPQELKRVLESGLLSFPLTDFDSQLRFAPEALRRAPRVAHALRRLGALRRGRHRRVLLPRAGRILPGHQAGRGHLPRPHADHRRGGRGHRRSAIQYAKETERAGAQGLLLLPHYLTEASQEGLIAHVQAVCRSVKLGVIVYNRGAARYAPETVAKLAETCPNLIGYKDGVGDIEHFVSVRRTLGDRVAYLGGLPTAEVFAGPTRRWAARSIRPPSSTSSRRPRSSSTTRTPRATRRPPNRIIDEFFLPYIALRNQGHGYAVSIVKAGATIAGHTAGPVRPPISDLKPAEVEQLAALMKKLGLAGNPPPLAGEGKSVTASLRAEVPDAPRRHRSCASCPSPGTTACS
jgi:5-dehydro-4-deoxyglucarate dehydratase